MRESIIQPPGKRECFICRSQQGLQRHHAIHGFANRRKADEDGLTVWLCAEDHMLLHDKGHFDRGLQQIAQKAWMQWNNATVEDWIARYGKSYL